MSADDGRAGRIVEVFSSLQGEGLYLGQRHAFVRLAGCNLACRYCDTSRSAGQSWSLRRLQAELSGVLQRRRHHAVSWTGGEPLLQEAFVTSMMGWVRRQGMKNYLETNGTLPASFQKASRLCDMVAMDIKLPSATGRQLWSRHLEFLRLAPKRTFVKVVLTRRTTKAEWRQVIRLMQEASPVIPLVLQPATARNGEEPARIRDVVLYFRQASALLKDVRLIPQWHPVWGVP
ncbi:MAG TPA: 7-carboxy-7-deazaguanine synthase QueE [Elusimicrobia bacterium]|nr:7-carboxy-7-deazaguanine synthase QueE [Elusimicrobiota bacterium]HBT61089.1 7-carboxy-7-deazaguanine synthase QueE [Elusimicrobiota bacterium]